MATYYYNAQAAGAGTGADWTDAFTTFAGALAAAASAGDVIKCHYTSQEELGGNTTYTFLANIDVICVDKDNSDALTPMGTSGWIGNSTTSRSVAFNGARTMRFYGLTVRTASSSSLGMSFATTDGADFTMESCYFWNGNTNTGVNIVFGTADTQAHVRLKDPTFRFGATAQGLLVSCFLEVEGGSVSSAGSAPTNLVKFQTADPAGGKATFEGSDLSHCGSGNLMADATTISAEAVFTNCKLGTSFVMLATQTVANKSGGRCYVFDCASGDTHVNIGYADAMGSVVVDTGIYLTAGPAVASWKIVTTANASSRSPFCTPWFDKYVAAGSVTPEIEILRDGSATAYQNDEVWGEWAYKGTSGTTQSTFANDRMALLGSAADQDAGAGTSSWTGEGGTAWSGKLTPGALTVNEVGYIRSRVCVAEPSITVYADPDV